MLFPSATQLRQPPRVVITGAGIVTALGVGWEKNAAGFRAGRTAFREVTLFDVSRQRVKVAAEVNLPPTLPKTKLTLRQTARLEQPRQFCHVPVDGDHVGEPGKNRADGALFFSSLAVDNVGADLPELPPNHHGA